MYTVLDFEFNQAYEFADAPVETDPTCRFEIIQIGAVRLNAALEEEARFSAFIRPKVYERLHPFVARMTGITQQQLSAADGFCDVYPAFREFVGDSRIYCVWGNSDIRALYRNLNYHGLISGDILAEYIDVQQLAVRYLKYGRGRNVGLKNAAELLGIETDMPFHDALSDAVYTARVLKKVHVQNDGVRIFNSKHVPKRSVGKHAKKARKAALTNG